MKKYETEQRKCLLTFLRENVDRQFYIEDIEGELLQRYSVSRSAIYRNISQMVAEGVVKKFASKTSRKSLYQYIGASECACHLHLKCSHCGKIIHLDKGTTDRLQELVQSGGEFVVDTGSSVLYGLCAQCRK